jgi:hypothetical protein
LRCPFEPCAVRLVAGERLLVGDGSVYAGGQAQARFGGVGAGLRADPVDRPSGGERGDLVLEAGAVRWREVNNIAVAALIATAGAGKSLVDHAAARAAITEVTATD